MQIFLTEKEVAKQIKVSLASLRRWRLMQRGPRFVKVGALVRYRPEDLEQWMASFPPGGLIHNSRKSL
jgi:excisionase family DNA binding protein